MSLNNNNFNNNIIFFYILPLKNVKVISGGGWKDHVMLTWTGESGSFLLCWEYLTTLPAN